MRLRREVVYLPLGSVTSLSKGQQKQQQLYALDVVIVAVAIVYLYLLGVYG